MSEFKFIYEGCAEDIGGSKEQQDSLGSWTSYNRNIEAKIICDGHGIYGQFCSKFVVNQLKMHFDNNQNELENNTENYIKELFSKIDKELRLALIKYIYRIDKTAKITEKDGGLYNNDLIILGGTTCSILFILKQQRKIISVNVGDSDILVTYKNSDNQCITIQLSGEDSPTSLLEYLRIKSEAQMPGLQFLYDVLDGPHSPIFSETSDSKITALKPSGSFYYKNVKHHIASLVKTPNNHNLSFTRALGDYNLKLFGVSCIPNYYEYPIDQFFISNDPICFIVASDGLHDNWLNNELSLFLMNQSNIENVDEIAKSLINENDLISKRNFGDTRDNVSFHLVYMTKF